MSGDQTDCWLRDEVPLGVKGLRRFGWASELIPIMMGRSSGERAETGRPSRALRAVGLAKTVGRRAWAEDLLRRYWDRLVTNLMPA